MNYNNDSNKNTINDEYCIYKNYVINKSKNDSDINFNVKMLKSKIIELEQIMIFYDKYENKLSFDNSIVSTINNTINNIDLLLYKFNKNIISNGQVKNKNIEFEF